MRPRLPDRRAGRRNHRRSLRSYLLGRAVYRLRHLHPFLRPGVLQHYGAPTYDDVLAPELWLLHEGALDHCEKCSAPYAAEPGETLCPICRVRRKNPFGLQMPEALRQRIEASKASHA